MITSTFPVLPVIIMHLAVKVGNEYPNYLDDVLKMKVFCVENRVLMLILYFINERHVEWIKSHLINLLIVWVVGVTRDMLTSKQHEKLNASESLVEVTCRAVNHIK